MGVTNPISSFGVSQAVIRDLETYEMFQILILDSVEPDYSQETVDLRGGSSPVPWASAPGEATGEITLTVKEYSAGVLKYFSPWIDGAINEEASGESSGNVSTLTNVIGTSVFSATTGIASIAVDPASALKFGDYVIEATGADTIDLYVNTNIDGHTYVDDNLKINAASITIPGSSATVVSNGLQFTGGSGTIALTTGDKATFSVRPITSYLLQHYMGKTGAYPKEFELTVVGERIGDKMRIARYPKCIAGGGGGLKFPYKEWSMFETTIQLLMNPTIGYVGLETFMNR